MPVMLFHPKYKSWWFIPKLHWFSTQFTHWFFGKTPKKINKLLLKAYTRQHFPLKMVLSTIFLCLKWFVYRSAFPTEKKASHSMLENAKKKVWNFFSSMYRHLIAHCIPVQWALYFKCRRLLFRYRSIYNAKRQENEYIIPTWIPKLNDAIGIGCIVFLRFVFVFNSRWNKYNFIGCYKNE